MPFSSHNDIKHITTGYKVRRDKSRQLIITRKHLKII